MITALTTTPYSPALQAAVDTALAAFPQDAARIAKAADLVARDYVVPPTATEPAWLVGPARWKVTRISPGQYACDCPDYAFRRQPCKHVMATWLSRKVQLLPAPRSMTYYGDWQGVAGVITIYESGDVQATFQPHTGMFPVAIPLERWHEVVLGGRKEMVDATYPRD